MTDARLDLALGALRAGRLLTALAAFRALRSALPADPAGAADPADAADAVRALAGLLELRLLRGEVEAAVELGTRLDALVGSACGSGVGAGVWVARAALASVRGEDDAAVAAYRCAGRLLGPEEPDTVGWRAGLAVALVRTGERRSAAEVAAAAHSDAVRLGDPSALALALRSLASAGGRAGAERIALLRSARAVLDGVPAAHLAARIGTDLAGLLLLDPAPGARDEALGLLREAEVHAGRQEARPLQQRVERLLLRAGETPHPVPSDAVEALTAAELRVASLVSGGLTNRATAATLQISVKAVEGHLSHVYRKLGVPSRSRLAAALGSVAV